MLHFIVFCSIGDIRDMLPSAKDREHPRCKRGRVRCCKMLHFIVFCSIGDIRDMLPSREIESIRVANADEGWI